MLCLGGKQGPSLLVHLVLLGSTFLHEGQVSGGGWAHHRVREQWTQCVHIAEQSVATWTQ